MKRGENNMRTNFQQDKIDYINVDKKDTNVNFWRCYRYFIKTIIDIVVLTVEAI